MKIFLCIFFLLSILQVKAQQNKIKFGIIGIPAQSGFGIGIIGYERLRKDEKTSWQLLLSMSGGSPAADAAKSNRKWATVERLWYFKNVNRKVGYYFSVFSEAGNRKTKPGHAHYPDTASLRETKSFEINPGASFGVVLKLGKNCSIESAAGPKVLFQSGKKYYTNLRYKKEFTEPYKDTKFGLRFLLSFSYQF